MIMVYPEIVCDEKLSSILLDDSRLLCDSRKSLQVKDDCLNFDENVIKRMAVVLESGGKYKLFPIQENTRSERTFYLGDSSPAEDE